MVRDLWWRGLPASIRGQVWKLSVANELNITSGNGVLCFFVQNYYSVLTCCLKFKDFYCEFCVHYCSFICSICWLHFSSF